LRNFLAMANALWPSSLQSALRANGSQANAKYLQLVRALFSRARHSSRSSQATVRPDGRPSNRTVVFRRASCSPPLTVTNNATAQRLPRRRWRRGAAHVCHRLAQPQGAHCVAAAAALATRTALTGNAGGRGGSLPVCGGGLVLSYHSAAVPDTRRAADHWCIARGPAAGGATRKVAGHVRVWALSVRLAAPGAATAGRRRGAGGGRRIASRGRGASAAHFLSGRDDSRRGGGVVIEEESAVAVEGIRGMEARGGQSLTDGPLPAAAEKALGVRMHSSL